MRVIAGTAKGRRLRAPRGSALRPTSDRVREALFSILAPELPGARFLDLYAGTGAVAIEALSRGCETAVLVERDPGHAALARGNLLACGLARRADVRVEAARPALRRLAMEGGSFSIVYADPPYDAADERALVLTELATLPSLIAVATVVLEGPSRAGFPGVEGLDLDRVVHYGDTALGFYRLRRG